MSDEKTLATEIEEFNTWEQASTWLSRHGWGLGLIEEQAILWKERFVEEAFELKENIKEAYIEVVEDLTANTDIITKVVEVSKELAEAAKEIATDISTNNPALPVKKPTISAKEPVKK